MSQYNLKKQTSASTVTPPTGYVGLWFDSAAGAFKWRDDAGVDTLLVTGVTSVSNSDGTLTISPTTGAVVASLASSYKTKSDNWYNKAFYNVLDNGITPAGTAAANVTAWDALMSSITDGATVYFPAGTYQFASALAIPSGKHVRVVGAGKNAKTTIQTTSGTANIFTCGDWYQEFVGLSFTSSVTRTAGAAILSGNNVGINVMDCSFAAMFNGVVFSGGASAGNIAFVFNCSFTNTVNFSIQVDGTNANAYISNCTADCSPATVCHVEINACGSLVISDSDFIRATNNMRLNPDSGTKGVFSVYCSNVFFDTAAASSVKFMGGAAGTNVQRVKFVNCWFSGSVTGCEFAANSSTNKPTAIDFIGCDIYSNSANGILGTEVQDFSLTNCRMAGNVTAAVNVLATAGSVTRFNIQNNRIGPTAGVGANGIGVNIQAGTYGAYQVSGNDVAGNTSNNNILDAGSVATTDMKCVEDNSGHLVKGAIATNGSGVTSGTGETLLFTGRIPANSVVAGQVFRVRLFGNSSSTGTLALKVKVGANGTTADTACFTPATSAAQVANHRASLECLIFVVSTVAVKADGVARFSNLFVEDAVIAAPANTAIVGSAAWFISVTCACSVGTFTVTEAVIEAV